MLTIEIEPTEGAAEIVDEADKRRALDRLVDHVLAGRSQATRAANQSELKATRVFALPLEEVSVKIRSGGPIDDAEDLELPYWAGVIPLALRASAPIADPEHAPRADLPSTAARYSRSNFEAGS